MVNVIGLGYIGLPTALIMASNGIEVIGTDTSIERIKTLNGAGDCFKERGMDELFRLGKEKAIKYSTEYQKTDTYIVAVPTPYNKFTKKIDVSHIVDAVRVIISKASEEALIIIESTISPGTIDKFIRPMLVEKNRTDLRLAHAPERIIPGNMIHELRYNNRTIGVDDLDTGKEVKALYSTFCKGEITITDIRTAEMTKVVENTFRAVNIAFANEIAKICRHADLDVYEIIRICNLHPRVSILQPGPGVGGHCISVDPWFLVGDYPSLAKVIDEAMKTNDGMPDFVLNRIHEIMKENRLHDIERVGLYGMTYKENVDDLRESPTLQLLASQRNHLGCPLKCYDPFIQENIVTNQAHDFDEFIDACDLVVIMVKHDEILNNMDKLSNKIVLDCHNIVKGTNIYHL